MNDLMMMMLPPSLLLRQRLHVWFLCLFSCILLWTCLAQIFALGNRITWRPWQRQLHSSASTTSFPAPNQDSHHPSPLPPPPQLPPPPPPPPRHYKRNGFLKISCNGGLNQMRAAICDMVTVAYLLNLTLVVPELDKKSFWADTSNFGDIFDVMHFIYSLKNEVHIVRRLPKRLRRIATNNSIMLPPVSWSTDKYYLEQLLCCCRSCHFSTNLM